MQDGSENQKIAGFLRISQILVGALMTGILVFAAIAFAIGGAPQSAPPLDKPVSIAMAGLAIIGLIASFVLPERVGASDTSQSPINFEQIGGNWVQRTILRIAPLEGACFANLVAYMVDHQWLSVGIVGGLLGLMLSFFPTQSRVQQFIEIQQAFK